MNPMGSGAGEGIWVRLTLVDGSVLRGFATGADSPNDFWSKFRTQMVRLEEAQRPGTNAPAEASTIYVNRDLIVVAEIVDRDD